jgi:hypothetical protein
MSFHQLVYCYAHIVDESALRNCLKAIHPDKLMSLRDEERRDVLACYNYMPWQFVNEARQLELPPNYCNHPSHASIVNKIGYVDPNGPPLHPHVYMSSWTSNTSAQNIPRKRSFKRKRDPDDPSYISVADYYRRNPLTLFHRHVDNMLSECKTGDSSFDSLFASIRRCLSRIVSSIPGMTIKKRSASQQFNVWRTLVWDILACLIPKCLYPDMVSSSIRFQIEHICSKAVVTTLLVYIKSVRDNLKILSSLSAMEYNAGRYISQCDDIALEILGSLERRDVALQQFSTQQEAESFLKLDGEMKQANAKREKIQFHLDNFSRLMLEETDKELCDYYNKEVLRYQKQLNSLDGIEQLPGNDLSFAGQH